LRTEVRTTTQELRTWIVREAYEAEALMWLEEPDRDDDGGGDEDDLAAPLRG
jgi:hypothetical protein